MQRGPRQLGIRLKLGDPIHRQVSHDERSISRGKYGVASLTRLSCVAAISMPVVLQLNYNLSFFEH